MPTFFDNLRVFLSGKKTYLVAAAGILTALAAYESGAITENELLLAVMNALGLSTLRAGVSKGA